MPVSVFAVTIVSASKQFYQEKLYSTSILLYDVSFFCAPAHETEILLF